VAFPQRSVWPNHVIDLNCTGNESSIWDCPHNRLVDRDCSTYSKDGALSCAGSFMMSSNRIYNGNLLQARAYTVLSAYGVEPLFDSCVLWHQELSYCCSEQDKTVCRVSSQYPITISPPLLHSLVP
jgi:hypothetical protein